MNYGRGSKHLTAAFILALATIGGVPGVIAQGGYPAKPIEIIVPWGPGGGADLLGRLVGKWLESDLRAVAPVINMPGAVGMIGTAKLASASADGHAISVLTADSLLMFDQPGAQTKPSDLVALGVMVRQPNGFFVRADSRFKSWQDVMKEAQEKPGVVSVAITGANSPDELFVKYLATKGIRTIAVGYTRPGERYSALLGGHVDLLCEQAGDVRGHLESRAMRPLLFFAPRRVDPPFAEVPVSAEFGYDILLPQFRAVMARAATDPSRLQILSDSLERFARSPEYATYLREQYALPDSFVPMRGADAFFQGEVEQMRRIFKLVGGQ